MYRIGICDDDIPFCRQIEEYIISYCTQHNINTTIDLFHSGEQLLASVQISGPFDLIFLDIDFKDNMNGIFVGKNIRNDLLSVNTQIVYISSFTEYAMQLFQIRPMDFLQKPVQESDMIRVLNTYTNLYIQKNRFFEYQIGKTTHQVRELYIRYLQSEGRIIHIHTLYGMDTFYEKLSTVMQRLEKDLFCCVHKSFIINWNYVAEYHNHILILNDGTKIPISQSKRRMIKEHIIKNSFT